MTIDNDTILSIFAIILLIGVSIMLGCQYMNKKKNNHKKMKWTCGVEGGCEMTMHGSYNSKKECEQKCGGNGGNDDYDYEYEEENYKNLKDQMEEVYKDKEDLKNRMEEHKRQMGLESKGF
jgi:hypothetical protein